MLNRQTHAAAADMLVLNLVEKQVPTLDATLKADLVGLTALKVFADGRSSDLRLLQIGRNVLANNIPAEAASIGLGQ